MKKLIAMLTLSALICAAFTACGQVEDSSSEPDTTTTAAVQDTEAPAETAEPEEPTPEEEVTVTEAPADDSEPEETETETTTVTEAEPEISVHEQNLASIVITSKFEEGFTFSGLLDMGLANANGPGLGYVMIPSFGGAGHMYFKVYSTNDGGVTWNYDENFGFYDELNGNSKHIALDDGGIMSFNIAGAYAERYPMVSILYFDGTRIQCTPLADVLADTELADGTLLKDAGEIDFDVTYLGGYKFYITYYNFESGAVIGEKEYDLSDAVFTALQTPAE
ncbi:hypothetical protein [Ruminococcus sp.]|uniref:hypothetical protein n=1 Tax=Ruminococcus sp. TaxID=41978 RepID=UPI0025D06E42|nr:hypothetical protein [Ruminococcus sp.]MBQ8967381.1 hypothetical protein [Ruminococcus sp.]